MSEYTLTEALADAREWTRDADTSQRGWRPALAVILREFRVQAEELAALRDSLIEANTELGVLISVVASARERAERADARLAEAERFLRQQVTDTCPSDWGAQVASFLALDSAASQPPVRGFRDEPSIEERVFHASLMDGATPQPTAYCRYCGVPDGDGHTADCQHPSLASQPSPVQE